MGIDPLPPRHPRCPLPGNAPKTWSYYQYYFGNEDQAKRRNGYGENHWSGAESLEWYSGKFVRDVMHGDGEYRWRYLGPDGAFITYEGRFYANRMHGYGVLSYPDGRVFNGLFCNNMRWGPGIESHSNLEENVGLWHGNRLVRLTWRPNAASVTLDLNNGPVAKKCVEPYRSLLTTRTEIVGEVNSAIELLKQNGADPISASEKWTKLYPKNCTDLASQLCHKDLFDYEYYRSKIVHLEEVDTFPELEQDQTDTDETDHPSSKTFFAWNNSDVMVSMMKHCFKHEFQRYRSGIDLLTLLTGPRSQYKQPAKHEIDCRILILASYLGSVESVVHMVNEENVHPNVADILGNTALMYATCGNHGDIIHFLIEAGANVNSVNDSCCTALGMALIGFACESKDVHSSKILQVVLPLTLSGVDAASTQKSLKQKSELELDLEWHMSRDLSVPSADRLATTAKVTPTKKNSNKSGMHLDAGLKDRRKSMAVDEATKERKKLDASTNTLDKEMLDDELKDITTREQLLFHDLNNEFTEKITNLFTITTVVPPVAYMFEVVDMVKAVEAITERKLSIVPVKPQAPSKNLKETTKPTKELTQQTSEKEISSESSADKEKAEKLNEHMTTILQLLSDGADPRLTRCPQPALRIALASGSADLLRLLVKHGADINEVYPNDLNQTILDMAIAQPLTYKNLAQARAILECGARADHRLECAAGTDPSQPKVEGPTLLHAVLAMHTENVIEEEVRCQLLELLLEYNCDALAQFNGCSAIDVAMTKDTSLFEIFVKSPKIDPNAIINDENQTVLVKMFLTQFSQKVPISERLQILTNLILYGADPMSQCRNGDATYENFFVFANQHLHTQNVVSMAKSTINNKPDVKGKKPNNNKPKKESSNEKQTKSTNKLDDLNDFKQALELVKNCARMLQVRWIQAKLLKELIEVVVKYEHRPWNMILPELKNKKACGLWLSSPRTLEIWDILKSKKKRTVIDKRILKHVLCIVQFNCNRSKTSFKMPLKAEEKGSIENDVCCILREHKLAASAETESMHLAKPYVTPELAVYADAKFQVCFECLLPFQDIKILCINCKQVSFCSQDCMKNNIDVNTGTHPCSEYLKNKYFASSTESYSRSDF